MMRNKKSSRTSPYLVQLIGALLLSMVSVMVPHTAFSQNGSWEAPIAANKYVNPLKDQDQALLAGKKLYNQFCAICHGKKGKGDGVAGMALKPRPADFTKDIVQKQSDGALFWKMTEGKAPMAGYKATLTEEQRWQLVTYIRSLDK